MKHTSLKRKTPLKAKTRLRRVSKVRASRLREYSRLRLEFLRKHVQCMICGAIATEAHHKRGRIGKRLNDFVHCLAVCFFCHRRIHDYPRWAREQGYITK
jgi:hypothetical protein